MLVESCRLIRIQDSTSPLYAGAEKIWMESFPECERRDASAERLCIDTDSRFVFNAVVLEGDTWRLDPSEVDAAGCGLDLSEADGFLSKEEAKHVVGLFSWWRLEAMVYGEHFAMSPAVRGKGIGAEVFRSVSETFRSENIPFVFEVESPDPSNPITLRRIGFYKRCGMHLLDHPYFQPRYHVEDTPVPMRLMSSDPTIDPAWAAAQIRSVYPVF